MGHPATIRPLLRRVKPRPGHYKTLVVDHLVIPSLSLRLLVTALPDDVSDASAPQHFPSRWMRIGPFQEHPEPAGTAAQLLLAVRGPATAPAARCYQPHPESESPSPGRPAGQSACESWSTGHPENDAKRNQRARPANSCNLMVRRVLTGRRDDLRGVGLARAGRVLMRREA